MKRLFKHEENTDIISKRRNKKIFQKRNEEKEIYKTFLMFFRNEYLKYP